MAPTGFVDNWNHIALTCTYSGTYSSSFYTIETQTHVSTLNMYINGELTNSWTYSNDPLVLFTATIGVPGTYTEKSYFTNIRFSNSVIYSSEASFENSNVEKRIPFV